MNSKEQLIREKEKIEAKIREIEEAEKLKDFIELKLGKRTFRVYKWENKPVGDFIKNMPQNCKLAEAQDFIDLFDKKLINYPEIGWEVYWTKHYSKRKQKEGLLSRFSLGRCSVLYSRDDDLSNSYSYGRVVVEVLK